MTVISAFVLPFLAHSLVLSIQDTHSTNHAIRKFKSAHAQQQSCCAVACSKPQKWPPEAEPARLTTQAPSDRTHRPQRVAHRVLNRARVSLVSRTRDSTHVRCNTQVGPVDALGLAVHHEPVLEGEGGRGDDVRDVRTNAP